MSDLIGELERDAVTELLNVAIGLAASSLSQLVRDEVRLTVPRIEFLASAAAAALLDKATGRAESVAVRQNFRSAFSGDILLVFPERSSLDLVRSMMGDDIPLDTLTELEQEALLEVGNIILNACLGSLANQLGIGIESSLPSYVRGRGARILGSGSVGTASELIMFLQVDFAVTAKNVQGYLAFVMDIVSAGQFTKAITAYLDRLMER
ncbi:Chemotaxis protein CheC [Candidatus Terasakiella magnetica]|nr:Chemotaxis protein CheC [Candidatus Terasakiella magnetica]